MHLVSTSFMQTPQFSRILDETFVCVRTVLFLSRLMPIVSDFVTNRVYYVVAYELKASSY